MDTTTKALISALKAARGISSDYAVAKLLGISHPAVSNWQRGRTQMDDENALKVCAMLNRPAGPVLATLAADRAKTPATRDAWQAAARALTSAAAVLVVAATLSAPWDSAYADGMDSSRTVYIMLNAILLIMLALDIARGVHNPSRAAHA